MKSIDTDLEQLKAVDVRTVDKECLVDLNTVRINQDVPVQERIVDFVKQIQNPYCFRIGDVAIKVVYQESGPTFQQNLEDALRMT